MGGALQVEVEWTKASSFDQIVWLDDKGITF